MTWLLDTKKVRYFYSRRDSAQTDGKAVLYHACRQWRWKARKCKELVRWHNAQKHVDITHSRWEPLLLWWSRTETSRSQSPFLSVRARYDVSVPVTWSHAGTVVSECYKNDVESQWKSLKFDPRHPKTPEPIVSKICTDNNVPDTCRHAKYHNYPIREFSPTYAKLPTECSLGYFFLEGRGVLTIRYRLIRCDDFDDQYVKRRRDVPFGIPKTKFYIFTPFFPKAQILVDFWHYLDKLFWLKTGFGVEDFVSKHP